jgi:hypothetical protein
MSLPWVKALARRSRIQLCRLPVGMHAHMPKVGAEALLHEAAGGAVERPPLLPSSAAGPCVGAAGGEPRGGGAPATDAGSLVVAARTSCAARSASSSWRSPGTPSGAVAAGSARGTKAGTPLLGVSATDSGAPGTASALRLLERKRGMPPGEVPPLPASLVAGLTPATPLVRDLKVMTPPYLRSGDAVASPPQAPLAGPDQTALAQENRSPCRYVFGQRPTGSTPRTNAQNFGEQATPLAESGSWAVFHRFVQPLPTGLSAAAGENLGPSTAYPQGCDAPPHSSDLPWARTWSQIGCRRPPRQVCRRSFLSRRASPRGLDRTIHYPPLRR